MNHTVYSHPQGFTVTFNDNTLIATDDDGKSVCLSIGLLVLVELAAELDNRWNSSTPYTFGACTIPDDHCLPNAAVMDYVLTPNPQEAAQLLRLLAAKLESEPRLLQPLQADAQALRYMPDDGRCHFDNRP